jgi:hypothetical protein
VTRRTFLSASYVMEVWWLGVSSGKHSVQIASIRGIEGQLSQVSQGAIRM